MREIGGKFERERNRKVREGRSRPVGSTLLGEKAGKYGGEVPF